MDDAQISEYLKELLDGRAVKAAVFTTYTFDPSFFELDVIPLLLPKNSTFSIDERVKQFQVREALREAELPIDVFYDHNIFRVNGESSPAMEYGCHGVSEGNRAFHAKLSLVLVSNGKEQPDSLLVGAGSNNLTRAGWWDNVECQHWEEVAQTGAENGFLEVLRADLDYLNGKLFNRSENSAVRRIQNFLNKCVPDTSAVPVHFFGLSQGPRFIDFLMDKLRPFDGTVELEIVSPFFADDTKNQLHEAFANLGVRSVRLLMPRDDRYQALCNLDYLTHIDNCENVTWANWVKETADSLGVGKDKTPFRELHAKIFHFLGQDLSYIFVGSVNFTHKALYENVEAGFLVATKPQPLLEAIDEELPEISQRTLEDLPGAAEQKAQGQMPFIALSFDWLNKTLSGRVVSESPVEIDLIGPDGAESPVVTGWRLNNTVTHFHNDTQALEKALGNGSLILVRGRICDSGASVAPHLVLLQQTHWSHKPQPELATLSPQQILAIYAGMSPERRQLLLTDARVKRLFELGQQGETSLIEDSQLENEFFSEYAELFHAFRMLRRDLTNPETSPEKQDYYLTGTGVDSLPTLIGRAEGVLNEDEGDSEPLHPVSAYLLLLSAKEIYTASEFASRPHVSSQAAHVEQLLETMREGNLLKLSSARHSNRKTFFDWFERQFLEQYRVAGEGASA
ncbi:hypothetical protein [uncultured Marinobacter sp.]|uniref:hypothetical protein n=1 Tax=uncultured Marinobacter sp. TaxID=187379 RepID=UPI0030DB4AE9|tara:strand:- start:18106 stop:20148 length:2043 start_codon:yes stop_codon:yes gene_type:complete